jgi:hypothetical protein
LSSPGSIRSPEHLVPGAPPVSSERLQALAAHHGPSLNQVAEYASGGRSAIISGLQLPAILRKSSPAKATAAPNPHRRSGTGSDAVLVRPLISVVLGERLVVTIVGNV